MARKKIAPENRKPRGETLSAPVGRFYIERMDAVLASIRQTKPKFKKVDLLRYWIDRDFESLAPEVKTDSSN